MNTSVSVPFKKYFFGKSVNGITFHWLRCTYQEQIEDAIANSAWIVYRPSMLAACPETWGEPADGPRESGYRVPRAQAQGDVSARTISVLISAVAGPWWRASVRGFS